MSNVQFTENSIGIKEEINQASLNLLDEISKEIKVQIQKNTRIDTGETKRHWEYYINEKKGESIIGNDLENAIWEEFGTGEFAVNGDGRKTPWYVPVEGYMGKKKPAFNGKVKIVYIKNKAYYKTNGKKPSRALTVTFQKTKQKIKRMAKEKFGGISE